MYIFSLTGQHLADFISSMRGSLVCYYKKYPSHNGFYRQRNIKNRRRYWLILIKTCSVVVVVVVNAKSNFLINFKKYNLHICRTSQTRYIFHGTPLNEYSRPAARLTDAARDGSRKVPVPFAWPERPISPRSYAAGASITLHL